ncbi:MAG: 2-amino-4-hydroxy-6-hydroxymethyldihydropteridine diphosphokinase [Pseudomonadota bacterium]
MFQQTVYLALGGNLNNPKAQVEEAIAQLSRLPDSQILSQSSLYRTLAMAAPDIDFVGTEPALTTGSDLLAARQNQEPDYCNAVIALNTSLPLRTLWRYIQGIEAAMGRARTKRWAARVIDIDILLYGTGRFVLPELHVPHVGLLTRAFVMIPLAEIAPTLVLPNQATAAAWAQKFTHESIEVWEAVAT